jgi:protein TonB
VLRSGCVVEWRIARGTGDADLDAAVETMIRRATLPAAMDGDRLEVTLSVRVLLR